MGVFEFILIIAVILLVIIFAIMAFTKKGRMFAKAATNSLFTEANKNPKIVAEYFDEKIEKLNECYVKADDAFRKVSGEKIANDREIAALEKKLERTKKSIVDAQKRGDVKNARIFANEAMSIETELDAKKEQVPVYEDAMKSAADLRERASAAVEAMEARKKADITRAKAGQVAQEIYAQFDKSRVSSDIDRILNQFSEYADEQEKMGMGARAAYESSPEALKIAAEKSNREYQADDYISKLVSSMSESK